MEPLPSPSVLVVVILIVGVCLFALLPALYVVFHALHWPHALRVMETAFLPLLFLALLAARLAYRHSSRHRHHGRPDDQGGGDGMA